MSTWAEQGRITDKDASTQFNAKQCKAVKKCTRCKDNAVHLWGAEDDDDDDHDDDYDNDNNDGRGGGGDGGNDDDARDFC